MWARALVLAWLMACPVHVIAADADYTVYLFRHAEKQLDASRDPALTDQGIARAQRLSRWLAGRHIMDIWSSDYRRTRDTVKPLAVLTGLETRIYDPRAQTQLLGWLKANRRNAVVSGHSNTIPELARMLCDCTVPDMNESEYDRLLVISMTADGPHLVSLQQAFLPD